MTPEELAAEKFDNLGQIRPSSNFGKVLTELASKSDIIVEIGTWCGLGSTLCLALGLKRPEQRMVTVEMAKAQHLQAKSRYDDPRITFVHGTLVLPHEVPPFAYPDPSFKSYYDEEVLMNKRTPYVLDQIPERIDLLLIDGGSWSANVEFMRLEGRVQKYIALDDTNPLKEEKCHRIRKLLLSHHGWRCLHDRLDDRNGWAVFERR